MTNPPKTSTPSAFAPALRIFLRYVAGALLAKGVLTPDVAGAIITDPELVPSLIDLASTAAGAALMAVVEGYYAIARRKGWST